MAVVSLTSMYSNGIVDLDNDSVMTMSCQEESCQEESCQEDRESQAGPLRLMNVAMVGG